MLASRRWMHNPPDMIEIACHMAMIEMETLLQIVCLSGRQRDRDNRLTQEHAVDNDLNEGIAGDFL